MKLFHSLFNRKSTDGPGLDPEFRAEMGPSFLKNRWVILATLLAIGLVVAIWGGSFFFQDGGVDDSISHYTCPMHPQIKEDHPGTCPICHMDLVPVYRNGKGSSSGSGSSSHAGDVQVSPDRQQMIGVKIWKVKKEKITDELVATGRVAFDPELAVAVREYLQVASRDPSLRRAAESRLRILGMGDEEIRNLSRGGSDYVSLYKPGEGNSVWIYATIYENESSSIRPGMKAIVELPDSGKEPLSGIVRSLSPIVDAKTRSITARIQIPASGGLDLRPDTFVNVHIRREMGDGLVVPVSAVLDTGKMQVVYRVIYSSTFRPVQVRTGARNEQWIEILDGLKEGDRVVSRAAFMIDSESRLMNPGFYPEDREEGGEKSTGEVHSHD